MIRGMMSILGIILALSTCFSEAKLCACFPHSSNSRISSVSRNVGLFSRANILHENNLMTFCGDDDDCADPDAYVPQGRYSKMGYRFQLKHDGDNDDKGGDPDAYVPQGRFRTKIPLYYKIRKEGGDDDDKGGDPDAYVPQGRFRNKQPRSMVQKQKGDDDDKGGDPDAYVPQGRRRNEDSQTIPGRCMYLRGGAGTKTN
eukprot:CAMPEP_0172188760 /NCGR_PEP_ID=MMETSP1050-20130122/22133_1 /TAXON_ID=233186 /ORGANISM="Cryptomonas curvata, Strain CCAP979/52" /LENGTH=199 /DNA_ID=CAMNT_0012863351 /DNA_START=35 /DNA_END=634 /DNA_ORIENTATION=-